MLVRARNLKLPLLALLVSLAAGDAAFATNTYPSYLGVSVSFTNIQETSTQGDPELPPAGAGTCCFGAPVGSGDQLLFFPTDFTATATGPSAIDTTGAQLQTLITATGPGATIDQVLISEFGDLTLLGGVDSGTGVFASMVGFVTVLEVNGIAVAPTVIAFNAGGANPFGVTAAFTPGDVGDGDYHRANYGAGTAVWDGQVVVDVQTIVPNATKVQLSLDNDLYAYTAANGITAKIQKKVVSGPSIIIGVIPEPSTALLLGGGLLAMAIRARGRRD
jgi:hypothetical protein